MPQKVRVRTKRTLPTYTRLRGVSWYANKLANKAIEGRLNHCMTSMLFSAFTLEAYLNHLGESKISFWDPLKKKLSPHDKLEVLSDVLGFKPDFGSRPYQTFRSMFKLRDLLAHARTETLALEGEFILTPGESPPKPLSEWEQLISLEGCQRFLDDTKAIVYDLSSRAGVSGDVVFSTEEIETTTTYLSDDAAPTS